MTFETYSQEELCGALIEKEYELECAQDMLQSLSMYETECQRKDGIIKDLRRELAAYKHNSQSKDISYVTMEEHLSVCEDHLQLKTKEVEKLTQELHALKKKVGSTTAPSQSTSSGKLSVLQRELSDKTSEILKLKQELSRQASLHESDKDSLRHTVTELQANLSSLKAKVQQLKSENEDLRQRLQTSEVAKDKLSATEQKRKEELGKLRTSLSSGKLAQAKQDFLEAEVERTKQRENELAIQLGKVKEELSSVCQRVVSISSQVLGGVTELTPNSLTVTTVAEQLTQECTNTRKELELSQEQLTELEKENERFMTTLSSLNQLWTDFKCELELVGKRSTPCERLESAFETLQTSLRSSQSEAESNGLVDVMMDSVQLVVSRVVKKWRELVDEVESHCVGLEMSSKEPGQRLSALSETLRQQRKENSHLTTRMSELEESHKREMEALREEHRDQLSNTVEESLAAERGKWSRELEALGRQLREEKETAVAELQSQQATLSEQLESVNQTLLAVNGRNDLLQAENAGLEVKVQTMETSLSNAIVTAQAQQETLRSKFTEEITGYKEQSHQHALTIVALEGKLVEAMERCKQLKAQNEALLAQTADRPRSAEQDDRSRKKIEKLQKLTDTLRHQLSLANEDRVKMQTQINQLESDLKTVESQFNDREAQITHEYQEELTDLKLTLSRQETELEGNRVEIAHLKSSVQERRKMEQELPVKMDSPNITTMEPVSEVALLGQRCSGERHSEVIANQRRAIAELRERITDLELAKPPVGSHQATLKELSRVRHELLKAQSLKAPAAPSTTVQCADSEDGEDQLRKTTEEYEVKIGELGASLSDLQDSLLYSERTYNHLVELISKNMADVSRPAAASFVGSKEQKQDILKERKKFADVVMKCLRTLHQKHRRATVGDGGLSTADMPGEATIESLQTALESTTEELEQQRRLNQALIKRNVFKESQLAESAKKPHHKCTS